jgi:hypothetical protein
MRKDRCGRAHAQSQPQYDPRMLRVVLCSAAVLLAAASSGTKAQVYRCGDSHVYTDKPCQGASPVDVRANVLDAGPRHMPPPLPQATPAPAIILPGPADAQQRSAPAGSIWDRRDTRDAESRSRTGPYRP